MPLTEQVPAQLAMLTEKVEVVEYEPREEGIHISAQVTIDTDNPVLAGHYPGLPVFPGVCQIDCVHRTILVAARIEGVAPVLSAVSTARFLKVVSPQDEIHIKTLIARIEREWRVTSVLRGESGPVARVDLRYRLRPGDTT